MPLDVSPLNILILLYTKQKEMNSTIRYIIGNNFMLLGVNDKAKWPLLQEDKNILFALGSLIHYCFEKKERNKNVNLHQD